MKEMKTLTVNGVAYTVADPDAAHIDDTAAAADTTWSSKKISEKLDAQIRSGISAAELAVVDKLCPAFSESGALVTCAPVVGYPLSVVSRIEPVQEGSSDPGPDNIRPISGHTGVTVRHCGKNLCDANNFTFTQIFYHKLATPIPPGTYKVSYDSVASDDTDTNACLIAFYPDFGGERIMYLNAARGTKEERQITLTKEAKYIYFYAAENHTAGKDDTATYTNLMISVAGGEYEPYRGGEFTMELGQTVYGGSLDWQTGVLTVDRTQIDLTGLNFDTGDGRTCWARLAEASQYGTHFQPCVCSHFKGDGGMEAYNGWNNTVSVSGSLLYVCSDMFASVEGGANGYLAAQNAAGNPVTLVYFLRTPITIQLTPKEILALSGVNTLYSDTGSTQASGRADIQALLGGLMAAKEGTENA